MNDDLSSVAKSILAHKPVMNPEQHFVGCPARGGAPVCTCGGSMPSTPESKALTAKMRALPPVPAHDAGVTEVAAYYPSVAEYIRELEKRLSSTR